MRVVIAGGRDFSNVALMANALSDLFQKHQHPSVVVSGRAAGADSLGEMWANENGVPVKPFPANWKEHGKGAGFIRNKQMAEYADVLVAFWDGKSRGTKHMIETMQAMQKPVHIIRYRP